MAERNKDQDFYMTLITLQVEDCLFRVPRHTLEAQSTFFRDKFSSPPPPDAEVEGWSDEHPIRLDGTTAQEFRWLLEVLFPGPRGTNIQLGSEKWISVLKLSQMWQFQQIRAIALEHMPYTFVEISPVEKVALAFQYDIKQWLLPGLNQLAQRSEPVNVEDVQLLGLEVALKIAAVRESLVFEPPQPSHRYQLSHGYQSSFRPFNPMPPPRTSPGPVDHIASSTRNASDVDFTPTIKKIFELSGAEFD